MKHYKSIIRKYGVYISLLMAGGCGADGVMETPVQETNTCHLIFDATIKGFDSSATTRAVDYDWPDNSNVYLMFVKVSPGLTGKPSIIRRKIYGHSTTMECFLQEARSCVMPIILKILRHRMCPGQSC